MPDFRGQELSSRSFVVAESDAMRSLVDAIQRVAQEREPVLIVGERGTGRELAARLIHFAGKRRKGPFVAVEAGAAPRPLFRDGFESHGGGPFEEADGGTLLVKELGALVRDSQRRLAGALRLSAGRKAEAPGAGRAHDVRVVATADTDLESAVVAGVFDRGLYDQMSRSVLHVPRLQERAADIAPLAAHFIRVYAREMGRGRLSVSTRAFARLVKHPWPGNVAELQDVARRLVIGARGSRIEAGDVDEVLPVVAERVPLEELSFEEMVRAKLAPFMRRVQGYPVDGLYAEVIGRVERPLLSLVLEHTGGNQVRAAEILGLNRNTLRRKLAEHGIRAQTLRARNAPRGDTKRAEVSG